MPSPDLTLLQSMLPYAQPSSYPQIRRSQYLADALQGLQEKGGENIRTPLALGSNLLATALLKRGMDKNFSGLTKTLTGDQNAYASALMKGLPGMESASPTPAQAAQPMAPFTPPPAQAGQPMQLHPPEQPSTPQAPQQGAGGIPTQPILPQELQRAKDLIASGNPALVQQGIELVKDMQKRAISPVPLSPGFAYNQDGSTRDLQHKTQDVGSPRPGVTVQQDETGKKTVVDTGIMGSTPPGQMMTGEGYQQLPVTAGGHTMPFGAPSVADLSKFQDESVQSAQVQAYRNILAKADAVFKGNPKTPYADLRRIETLQEALNGNPTLAVREGLIHEIKDAQGDIAKIIGGFNNTFNRSGYLDDTARTQIDAVIRDAVEERYHAASSYLQDRKKLLDTMGYPESVLPQLQEPPANTPSAAPVQAGAPKRPPNVPPTAKWNGQMWVP